MTGNAEPFTFGINPCVGEAANVLVGLSSVSALGVIGARNNGSCGVHRDFDIVDAHEAGLEFRVGEIRQELSAIADFPVPLRIQEPIADHARDGSGIAHDLRLIPHTLEGHEFGRFARGLRKRRRRHQKTAQCQLHNGLSAIHGLTFQWGAVSTDRVSLARAW